MNIALVKFRYFDITTNTDVKALFARYRATIDGLRAKNLGTTFVHVAAPFSVEHGGLKESLKRPNKGFRLSGEFQANGVPACDAYASLVPNVLLYFYTRNAASMGITDTALSPRLSYLDERTPLRLGFSSPMSKLSPT